MIVVYFYLIDCDENGIKPKGGEVLLTSPWSVILFLVGTHSNNSERSCRWLIFLSRCLMPIVSFTVWQTPNRPLDTFENW
jgi:hypothetical protein